MPECKFLLHPIPGSRFIVKGLHNQPLSEESPVINFGKKPFDWMNDAQWQLLLVRAMVTSLWVYLAQ